MDREAENKVLHFPKASDFADSIQKIEDKKLTTLYPSSLIEKYDLKDNVSYSQKTPIFYDKKAGLFFVAMDERFLVDITADEIIDGGLKNVRVYQNKTRKSNYLAFTAITTSQLISDLKEKGKTLDIVKTIYRRRFLKMRDAKRVIVLKFETDNQDSMTTKGTSQFNIPNYSDRDSVIDLMYRQKMEMEIFQAAQIETHFYLMDELGIINPKAIINFNVNETDYDKNKAEVEDELTYKTRNGGLTYLVIKYTQEDWDFIKNLQEKMHQLSRDLESFFLSTKTEIGLSDKSFSEGISSSLAGKLLENK